MPNATPGGGLSGQVCNTTAGSGGTVTLRLLFGVTFWCGIHKLAYRVQPTRTQVEMQYWGNDV